jgi:putative hemolysin
VLDTAIEGDSADQIVATYRLLRQEVAMRHSGFYSASEFDIAPLIARNPGKNFLELGRSCVLATSSQQAHRRTALAGQSGHMR